MGVFTSGGNKSSNRIGPAVSRRLRAAGFNISPSASRNVRDGITVAVRGDMVSVLVDLPGTARSEIARDIAAVAATWPQAGTVETREPGNGATFVRFVYGR